MPPLYPMQGFGEIYFCNIVAKIYFAMTIIIYTFESLFKTYTP